MSVLAASRMSPFVFTENTDAKPRMITACAGRAPPRTIAGAAIIASTAVAAVLRKLCRGCARPERWKMLTEVGATREGTVVSRVRGAAQTLYRSSDVAG